MPVQCDFLAARGPVSRNIWFIQGDRKSGYFNEAAHADYTQAGI